MVPEEVPVNPTDTTNNQYERQREWRKRLYGRQREVDVLRGIFTICCVGTGCGDFPSSTTAQSESEQHGVACARLVLVTGPQGVGKRSLVKSLQPPIEGIGGCYVLSTICSGNGNGISCNKEQKLLLQPNKSAMLNAVRRLIDVMDAETIKFVLQKYFTAPSDRDLLSEMLGPTVLDHPIRWTESESVTAAIRPMTDAKLLTNADHSWSIPSSTSTIIERLIAAVSTLVPLIIVLDQAELVNHDQLYAILDMIALDTEAVFDSPSKGLLILLLCNDDDVEASSRLRSRLDGSPVAGSPADTYFRSWSSRTSQKMHTLEISNLHPVDTHEMIEEWSVGRSMESNQIRDLVSFVQEKTLGNPQYTLLMLLYLGRSEFKHDIKVYLNDDTAGIPTGVCVLFRALCRSVDTLTQTVVETTAALVECSLNQDNVTCEALEIILRQPCTDALRLADEHLLLEYDTRQIRFTYPLLQKVAYNMIPESNRAQVHLRIGRRLWKNLSLKENFDDADLLFVVARHLHLGVTLIADSAEIHMTIRIQYEAGKRAMQAGDFTAASSFFEFAMVMASDEMWSDELYDTSLMLCNGAAEAYYSAGNFTSMELLLNIVFENARTFRDTLQANTTLVLANGSRNRFSEAVVTATELLDKLGLRLPRNPGMFDVLVEHVKLRLLLRGKSNRFFSNLPTLTDSDKIATMILLNFTMMYSYTTRPMYSLLAMFSLIRLAIQYGMTGAAATAIAAYGVIVVTRFGRIEEGFRYGQIAMDLLDRMESRAWLSRVYYLVYGCINTWMRPFHESLDPLLRAQRAALKTGDIEGGLTCAWLRLLIAFYAGKSLSYLYQDAEVLRHMMESHGQTLSLDFFQPFCRLVGKLSGRPLPADEVFACSANADNKQVLSHQALCRAIVYYHFGDYQLAMEAVSRAQDYADDSDFLVDFYHGLACLALARERIGLPRRILIAKGRRSLARLTRNAALCPFNCCNKRDLLRAELETFRGRPLQALSLFEESIQMAKAEGFHQEEGLAYERLARFHCFLGHPLTAIPYFSFARDAYVQWGADELVRRMDEQMEANDTLGVAHKAKVNGR